MPHLYLRRIQINLGEQIMSIFDKKEDIFELIDKFDKSSAAELKLADGDKKIHLKKSCNNAPNIPAPIISVPVPNLIQSKINEISDGDIVEATKESSNSGKIVTAPLIGVYYAAPSPDSEPFIEVGKKINKGDILCIIEAMKVMNDIDSEIEGEVAEIFVENAQAVEFGQPLFRIK